MKLQSLIIDDEPLAHKVIAKYAADLPHLEIVGSAYSAMEAMSLMSQTPVDLIFLDINMPRIQGLDFLRTLPNPPLCIVTTAYKEFALEGYELKVIDYLLKPIVFERFFQAVNRAMEQKRLLDGKAPDSAPAVSAPAEEPTLFLKEDRKVHQVKVKEIDYLESYGSYVKVHVSGNTIITLDRLTNFEQKLKPHQFIRVHKSYLIPIDRIELIEGNELVVSGKRLPIGAVYRHNVNDLFK